MKKHKTAKDISVLIIEENNSDIELITEYLSQSKWVNETIHVVDTVKKAKTILATIIENLQEQKDFRSVRIILDVDPV